ncbi:RagB/SusD family nutrient uptake outer membrane protein [Weeksellaceae bacterium A-14]
MKLNKNILNVFLGIGIIITSNSCSDYLDTEPITDRAVELSNTPYTKASEAEDLMATIYNDLGNEYWQLDYFFNGDAQTDIAYQGGDNPQNAQQSEYRILATNSNVSRDWGYLYGRINNCNKVLNYVDNIPDTALTKERREEMKAEAAIMRALYYFHAVQLWGDIPLVTQAVIGVTSDNFNDVYSQVYPERKSKEEVYNFILADLEGALPNAPSSTNKYRANRGVALMLLAQVNATMPNPDFTKVLNYTGLLQGEGYSLLSNFDELFDGNHNANSESIFEINANGSSIWWWGSSMFIGEDWKKFNTPSNDLVSSYNQENDMIRKNSTVKFASVGWADNYWPSSSYPFAWKQRDTSGYQHVYIFRYADALLLRAEAMVRTGNYGLAKPLIDQVRGRVGLSPIDDITSEDDGISKVLWERKLELAFEGQRWFDLKRTGKALDILKKRKDGNGNILSFVSNLTEKKLLWPIPQSQIDNNPNLTQNPGY